MLLYKWSWRYRSERKSLCRKVINAKYERGEVKLLPFDTSSWNKSWIWRDICRPLDPALASTDPFVSNLQVQLDDGKILEFWSDKWVSNLCLKELFLRTFVLVVNKTEKVAEFGNWEGTIWRWVVLLCRALFVRNWRLMRRSTKPWEGSSRMFSPPTASNGLNRHLKVTQFYSLAKAELLCKTYLETKIKR
ncbi:hypothetical protein V6N11_060399 [Hibiscus sabdariffa]|uniref:Reverse transcriptase zinc-binding domain-containing protein n=1 Tax=Hibiscus sabdariffa TaxID=183260 RepID=A0ABR2QQ73_9ROSI